MPKHAISVTLAQENLTWLKGRAGAAGQSVSALLDQLVTTARKGAGAAPARSVVGTIDIDSSDPLLAGADAAVRGVYADSVGRPLLVSEGESTPPRRRRQSRKRRA